jgi:hypothetical protein
VLQLNLGAQAVAADELPAEISDPVEIFSHARPEGTPAGTWPAWSARWWMGPLR